MSVGSVPLSYDNLKFEEQKRCSKITKEFNEYFKNSYVTLEKKNEILKRLMNSVGDDINIIPPFYCDIGKNIYLGDRIYMNFNTIISDFEKVTIGNDCFFGTNCKIITTSNPILDNKIMKNKDKMQTRPIKIGNDCFFGSGCIIYSGVTIGNNVIVGAGSVVTNNIESGTIVCGNPARVLKYI